MEYKYYSAKFMYAFYMHHQSGLRLQQQRGGGREHAVNGQSSLLQASGDVQVQGAAER